MKKSNHVSLPINLKTKYINIFLLKSSSYKSGIIKVTISKNICPF